MQLFSSNKKKRKRPTASPHAPSPHHSNSDSDSNSNSSDSDSDDDTDQSTTSTTSTTNLAPTTFRQLGVAEWLCIACRQLGITKPTPVQSHCIPPILNGQNVLGAAQTGSGKTAAFLLPILHRLSEDPYGIFALILTPTRELAFQISQQVEAFGAQLPVRQCTVVGGVDMTKQSTALDNRPHIVVATPGK